MMKIAVFHNLPSGGAKRALYGNLSYLAKNNEVHVFIPSTANEEYLPLNNVVDNIKKYDIKYDIFNFLYSALKYRPSAISLDVLDKVQKKIADDVNSGNFDVVLCEQDQHTMAPFFLKYVELPCVYFCQQPNVFRQDISSKIYKDAGLKYKNLKESLFYTFYKNKIIKQDKNIASLSKYVVSNSKFSNNIIYESYGIKAHVSYLGVDNKLFEHEDVELQNFVLSVGQCIPEKGFDFIIKSLAKIDPKIRPELVLVSDQGNLHWLRYIEDLALRSDVKLKILTLIEDHELVRLYNKAKLVLYAPYSEPFGLVPLESMSCGTPVVGVEDGGVKESVIDGKTGILVERDFKVFADAIMDLSNNEELYNEMSKKSIKCINKFWTLENSGKRLYGHLKRVSKIRGL